MRVIWEFIVGIDSPQTVVVTENSVFLKIDQSHDFAKLWFEVDPKAPPQARTFVPILTGRSFDENYGSYVGTVVSKNFVRHFYEVKRC